MNSIEYGKTLTYSDISKVIAKKRGLKRMSSQAVVDIEEDGQCQNMYMSLIQ